METPTSFTEATERFLEASDWLTDEHLPAIISLNSLAAALDKEITAAMVAQYGLVYRSLLKARTTEAADDPLEAMLDA